MSIEHSPARSKRMLKAREVAERTGLSRVTIWRRIRAGTVRDIYRPQWSGLTSPDDVWSGLEILANHNVLRVDKKLTAGAPREVIYINPGALRVA